MAIGLISWRLQTISPGRPDCRSCYGLAQAGAACGTECEDEEEVMNCCGPEEKTVYVCAACSKQCNDGEEAIRCCLAPPVVKWKCEDCDNFHENAEAAAACCGSPARSPVPARF